LGGRNSSITLQKEGEKPGFLALPQKDELRCRGLGRFRTVVQDGNVEEGTLPAGQVIGLINEQKSAKDLIEEIINDSIMIMRNLGKESEL